jgi:hypothetical protein
MWAFVEQFWWVGAILAAIVLVVIVVDGVGRGRTNDRPLMPS